MLPQVVGPHVHQLHRVQGAAAQMGAGCGVGGDALEAEVGLAVGLEGARHDKIGVGGVPGEGGIQLIEHAGAGHKSLAASTLFRWTAEEDHRAGPPCVP